MPSAAAHQLFDTHPLVFADPFAGRILGPQAAQVQRTPGRFAQHRPRPHSIALRAFVVARSRYAEDLLAQAFYSGVRQYVILGAGLDTFALRNPYPGLRVFEVDHPATQSWKRTLLADAGLPAPAFLSYVPVDFERQWLATELVGGGADLAKPTFFSWLGVVPYLTLNAFRANASFIVSQPPGSGVVFDYQQPRAVLPPEEQLARDSFSQRVRLAGEDLRLALTRAQAAATLAPMAVAEDLGSTGLNARYFARRPDGLRLLGAGARIVSAWR